MGRSDGSGEEPAEVRKTSVLKRRCRGWAVAQAKWRSGVCCGVGGVGILGMLAWAAWKPVLGRGGQTSENGCGDGRFSNIRGRGLVARIALV